MNLLELVAAVEGSFSRAAEVIHNGAAHRPGGLEFIPEAAPTKTTTRDPNWAPKPIDPPPGLVDATGHPYVIRKRYDVGNMHEGGVSLCTRGRYQDRLVFPVRRYPDGAWLYFQTRATWDKGEQIAGHKFIKNLNPTTPDPANYAAPGDVLLGLDLLIAARLDWAMIVEGPTDWLGVGVGGVATFGKNLTDGQISLLARAGVRRVYLAFDPDAWFSDRPGRPAPAQRAAQRLAAVFDLRVVRYAPGTDPGDFTPDQNAAARDAATAFSADRLAYIG